jgi:hypothetical protein
VLTCTEGGNDFALVCSLAVCCLYCCSACPLVLFCCRYVAYKHHQLLFLDMLGGLYQLAVAASLTKCSVFAHPATWILLLITLIRALPHMPLLLGYRQKHIRYAWIGYVTWAAVVPCMDRVCDMSSRGPLHG